VNDEKRVGALEARRQEYLVEEGSIASLTSVCVEKLRAAAKNPMFCRDPRLLIFLHRWSEWTTLEEVRAWLARHTEDAKGAIWLLTVLLGETHSWGREHRMRYYIHLPTVEKFSDVTKLTQLVGTLKESGLLKKESIALREFKKALKRREEGKSDEAWKNSDEYEDEEVND
jgi:hypothetical protein